MRINWSAFRSGILLGFAIAFSLAAGAIYMQGCQSTPEQQVANVQAREGVTAVAATIAADPKASESTKSVATKVDAVTKAAITPTGEVTPESVGAAVATAFPAYGLYALIGVQLFRLVSDQLAMRKQNKVIAESAATKTKEAT